MSSSASKRPPISLTVLLSVIFGTFVAWAAWFEIDQTVRAQGLIITSARTQIIQAADGGVLSEILVQEGQPVKAGERLAVLEKSAAALLLRKVGPKWPRCKRP